jgi:hypothetical protein
MGKILNTLRYGKTKTKTLIISVFVLMVAAIVLGIIGINGMNIILLGISMVLFIICIFMVFKLEGVTKEIDPSDDESGEKGPSPTAPGGKAQSRTAMQTETASRTERAERPDAGAAERAGRTERSNAGETERAVRAEKPNAGEIERSGRAENSDRKRQAQEKLIKTLRGKSRGPKAVRAQLERKLLLEIIKAGKRSAVRNTKTYKKRMKEAVKVRNKTLSEMRAAEGRPAPNAGTVTQRTISQARENKASTAEPAIGNVSGEDRTLREDKTAREERVGTDPRTQSDRENEPVVSSRNDSKTDYRTYTKSEVKRLRKVYKIPKDACRIIIDSCKSLAIDHAPAFFWVKKGRIYLLAFEESARCETMSMNNMDVSYKKNIREEEIIKYNSMREMGVYKDFEEMMPTFSIHGGAAGNEYYKNLYVIGKDLTVTPRSLRSLMSQFSFKIRIFDSLGINGSYSEYFKKAYEQRVMWTDGVISQNQYQNNIRDILQSMVDDDSIIRYDFMDDLAKMVHHRLITDEYAEFYKNKRL